jgi:dihydrolipoamide dehydrogenase
MKWYVWTVVAVTIGVYASNNPFALDENFKKVDQEQSTLLKELQSVAVKQEADEDAALEAELAEDTEETPEETVPAKKPQETKKPEPEAEVVVVEKVAEPVTTPEPAIPPAEEIVTIEKIKEVAVDTPEPKPETKKVTVVVDTQPVVEKSDDKKEKALAEAKRAEEKRKAEEAKRAEAAKKAEEAEAARRAEEAARKEYDIIIIGSGIGGAATGLRASQLGLKPLIIDKGPVGGTCVNVGCVPTKYLLRISEYAMDTRKYAVQHILEVPPNLNLPAVMQRKRELIDQVIAWYTDLVFPSYNIDLLIGEAKLSGPKSVKVNGITLTAKKGIVIATGSKPSIPPIKGVKEALENGCAILSDHALNLETVPSTLAIIGGGPIGLELGTVWKGFGAEIVILEMMPRILPTMDPDISKTLHQILEGEGFKIHVSTPVKEIVPETCTVKAEGLEIKADKILIATGRKPNTGLLGLENVGVKTGSKGEIIVDKHLRTSIPSIYAVGDVTGDPLLASKAKVQGIVAAENIAGGNKNYDPSVIPMAVFTDPEAAGVGVSASKRDPKYLVKRFPTAVNYRSIVYERTFGIAKIVAEKDTRRIVGFHMVGLHASEVVNAATVAIVRGLTLDQAVETIFTHPVMSEVFLDAAHLALGINVYLPRR